MANALTGKSVVVTGATSGIGLATVHKLAESGAFVIGVGRSESRINQARERILDASLDARVVFMLADLAELAQVSQVSGEITRLLKQIGFHSLDALVNNAGIYSERKVMTADRIEQTFAVNHLAPFLLTLELLPWLQHSESGRVLMVSSYSHRTTPLCLGRITNPWPYISLLAYKRSKLCNVLFAYELNRRFEDLTAFAVDPGLVNTAIASKGSQGISHWVWRRRRLKGTSADVPAETILYLIGEPKIDTSQGFYFKDCAPLTPSRKARREDLGKRLWKMSAELIGSL